MFNRRNSTVTGLALGIFLGTAIAPALSADQADGNETVTFSELLNQMTDLDRLARFPSPAFRTKQASSYDRRSTDENEATLENWLANEDWVDKDHLDNFARIDEKDGEKEYVLMDEPGPGVIVRIWSAVAERGGDIRIYLDGADEPVIDMPFEDLLGGQGERFYVSTGERETVSEPRGAKPIDVPSPISGQRAAGWNCFLPLPYAKHCKVVLTEAEETYWYQISYRQYQPGTSVETFSRDVYKQHRNRVRAVAKRLANLQAKTAGRPKTQETLRQHSFETERVQASCELNLTQPKQEIREFTCKITAEDMEAALRQCLLQITFDGADRPQVEAPLGDFFATAPGANTLNTLPFTVRPDGTMTCRFRMPYRKQADIRVSNHGEQPVSLRMTATTAPHEWSDASLYFHARWRSEGPMKSHPRRDWNYIQLTGKGVYVGNMFHIANANLDWWGEGDEKIFVDGETFPSIFGTGTEDYYSYACCARDLFSHAYHNQPRSDGPGNSGHTCLSRFHVMDPIPFVDSLRFEMEIWHWDNDNIWMAVTNYFYAKPGVKDNIAPIDPASLYVPKLPPPEQRVGRNLFPDS